MMRLPTMYGMGEAFHQCPSEVALCYGMHADVRNSDGSYNNNEGIFGDQIREMDWAVGRVLASVASYNLMNNTIFFFSSDHGPHVELCLEGGTYKCINV